MGNQGLCSAGSAGDVDRHGSRGDIDDYDAPVDLTCGGCGSQGSRQDARFKEWGDDADKQRSMQVGNLETLRGDRISAFSKEIKASSMCGISSMTCGKAIRAPTRYLADTLDDCLVVDSKDGPIWMDDEHAEVQAFGGRTLPRGIKASPEGFQEELQKKYELEMGARLGRAKAGKAKRTNAGGAKQKAPTGAGAPDDWHSTPAAAPAPTTASVTRMV